MCSVGCQRLNVCRLTKTCSLHLGIHHPFKSLMQDLQSLRRHLGNLFVITAFMDQFGGGLAYNIALTIGTASPERARSDAHTADAAHPMASVLYAAQDICSQACITDAASLETMLEAIHKQSDVAQECSKTDKALALADLELHFEIASEQAWEALREVQAGFPVSGGDFAAWKQARMQRT